MNRVYLGLALAACGLTLGCQGNNSQLNPFAAYGPQRVPPPATGSYAQPATTAPYYQPQVGAAPAATLGAPAAGAYAPLGGTLAPPPTSGAAPALTAPPAMTYPATGAPPANQWRGSSYDTASNSNVQLTSAEEPIQSVTTPVAATGAPTLQTQGMRVNEPAGGLNWQPVSQ
ncbi:hypothetical protein LOC68_27735 [Blastopirellula sp. JC732]|uniref:Uncharacterized protein n=1 Tax=Blastopirellula sediminis TaxID=2894196 RepID=A0A9X1SN03_9BACT|nr:hypothetical protein [Blastopirellula sediminis]MCC9604497.1 hypothetical protein [Blastopirellula sediminis]MCC9632204.1 hypothetical protein [Blastopirellula sediminis]